MSKMEKSIKTNKNIPNKANFQNAKNEHNSSLHNNYKQKTTNYELLKTNPIKANLVPSEVEGSIKKVRKFH